MFWFDFAQKYNKNSYFWSCQFVFFYIFNTNRPLEFNMQFFIPKWTDLGLIIGGMEDDCKDGLSNRSPFSRSKLPFCMLKAALLQAERAALKNWWACDGEPVGVEDGGTAVPPVRESGPTGAFFMSFYNANPAYCRNFAA